MKRISLSFLSAFTAASLLIPALSAHAYVDTFPPTVDVVRPTSGVAGVAVEYYAAYNDDTGVTVCKLVEGGTDHGDMTLGGGIAKLSIVLTAGTHILQVKCSDAAGNWGAGEASTVNISTAGTVGAVTPATATIGVATTLSATYSSFTAPYTAHGCWLVVDGTTIYPEMSLSGGVDSVNGTASKSYTFASNGTYAVHVSCLENGGSYKVGSDTTVVVSAAADTTAPVVGAISPTSAVVGSSVSYSATYNDAGGVTLCQLMEGGTNYGTMTLSSGTASLFLSLSLGTHNLQAQCKDGAGNWGYGGTTTVLVSAVPVADTTAPIVGTIGTTSAVVGSAVTLRADYLDNVGVTQCTLHVTGITPGTAYLSGLASNGSTYLSWVPTSIGTALAYYECRDAANNVGYGPGRSITVTAPGAALPGALIKLVCPAGAAVDHPCKAVYYVGSDAKRHAFPNSKVYFTWYADFSSVQDVSASTMSSYSLGRNVTYRPGIKMVKFTTVNTVYAVSRGGLLRPIASEAIASALYGTNWNQRIDDISDAFYTNYTFGASINFASDYSPTGESAAVTTVDANL